VGSAGFSPVVDGTVLPHRPFDPTAPMESSDVPVVISTTLEDAALSLTNFDLDEAGLKTMLTERYGAKAEPMLMMYRKRYPNKSPYLIQAQIATDSGFRRHAILQAERKAAIGKAPAYMYLWAYESPGFRGKFGAVDGTDVSASSITSVTASAALAPPGSAHCGTNSLPPGCPWRRRRTEQSEDSALARLRCVEEGHYDL
jgi:para-nitrobenzyl esterase